MNQKTFEDLIFSFLLKRDRGEEQIDTIVEFRRIYKTKFADKVNDVTNLISNCNRENYNKFKNSNIKLNLKKDEPLFINLNHVFKEILTIANDGNKNYFESTRMLVFINHRFSLCKKNYDPKDPVQKCELVNLLKAILREFAVLELYYQNENNKKNENNEKTTVHHAIIARVFEELMEIAQIQDLDILEKTWEKSKTRTFGLVDKNLIFLLNLTEEIGDNIFAKEHVLQKAV